MDGKEGKGGLGKKRGKEQKSGGEGRENEGGVREQFISVSLSGLAEYHLYNRAVKHMCF